jgi:hypothetical protein
MVQGYSVEEQALRDKLISQIEGQMTELTDILSGKEKE